jgi:hypothetical protein
VRKLHHKWAWGNFGPARLARVLGGVAGIGMIAGLGVCGRIKEGNSVVAPSASTPACGSAVGSFGAGCFLVRLKPCPSGSCADGEGLWLGVSWAGGRA